MQLVCAGRIPHVSPPLGCQDPRHAQVGLLQILVQAANGRFYCVARLLILHKTLMMWSVGYVVCG